LIRNFINRVRSKLFLKISLVFIISLVVILISTITFHRVFFKPKNIPGGIRQIVNNANYMIKEIGFPPDLKKAELISEKTKVPISIKHNNSTWKSEVGIKDPDQITLTPYKEFEGFAAGFNDLGLCVSYENTAYKVLFVMHRKREGFRRIVNSLIMTLLSFAILVIVVLFFFIRWLLKPVRVLKEGVDQVSRGKLNLEMPVRNSDELGKLTMSFNSMTNRIGEMLESRDQLLRDVSHELRSPLTRIKMGLEFIDEGGAKRGIAEDVSELGMMISELLETDRLNSRFGKLKLEQTNVAELIKNIINEFDGKNPGILMDGFPNHLKLKIDRGRVMILLRNIFSNALRYSDSDGAPVRVSCKEDSGETIIMIKDSGIGIPEDELPYIFEPFYRVDKSRSRETGGYGLGLSLSKKIMDAHKGMIDVTSVQGKGTTIKLIFHYSE